MPTRSLEIESAFDHQRKRPSPGIHIHVSPDYGFSCSFRRGADLYERFSDSARLAMQRANETAQMRNEQLRPEHIMLAIVEDENCVATKVLKHFGVGTESVSTIMQSCVEIGPRLP